MGRLPASGRAGQVTKGRNQAVGVEGGGRAAGEAAAGAEAEAVAASAR